VTYPTQWEADVVLSDGGTVHVRPVRPDDDVNIQDLHSRLSADTIYFRFFTPLPVLSPDLLRRFVNVDYEDRMALVAELNSQLVAVARYDRLPGSDEAEVAFVVEDAHQGRGLGTLLLEHLAGVGRENGIRRFVAETLPQNMRMLSVFREAGFGDERSLEDGVVRVTFAISPTDASVAAMHERERRAAARSVDRLLAPRSIVVVGAGREPGGMGHEVFRNLLRAGFAGPVYPVHPEATSVASVRAWPSVMAVPDDIDLAVIVVPAAAVPEVVEQCAAKRVRALVVLSAGFAETGPDGADAERELVLQARRSGMRLVGPNCMGVVNTAPDVRMNATLGAYLPPTGRVAFSSQSGALGIAIMQEAARLGLGISTFVSVGNKSDVSGNDLIQYWEDDPATDVVLLYLESFGNPRSFSRIARRVSRKKPIVAVKGGRTTAGSRAAVSHTAAPTNSDTGVDALFLQTGVIRVDTLEELFDVGRVLASQPLPAGRRVAVVGNAGGPGILATDAAEGAGLEVVRVVDLGGAVSGASFEAAVSGMLTASDVDAVVVIFIPPMATPPDDVSAAIDTAVAAHPGKPVLANFLSVGRRSTDRPEPHLGTGVPVFEFPESAARALARVCTYAEWRRRPEGVEVSFDGIDVNRAQQLITTALDAAGGETWLGVDDLTTLLDMYGVPFTPSRPVATTGDAVRAADELGYPVVLRTASGELRLGLSSADAVTEAFRALGPEAGAIAVQPMVEPGVDTVVGLVTDPSFGPLVMFGTGGPAAELLGDRAYRVLPLTDIDAASLVRSVRGAPLLFGYRGSPEADIDSLEDVVLRVARMADDLPEIAEIELDPVIASVKGAHAVDARVRVAPWTPRPELALRRLR
jgi:acyl-CoA synthetase (NDP forming)/GNAT superfamily N-acetyltransferase